MNLWCKKKNKTPPNNIQTVPPPTHTHLPGLKDPVVVGRANGTIPCLLVEKKESKVKGRIKESRPFGFIIVPSNRNTYVIVIYDIILEKRFL